LQHPNIRDIERDGDQRRLRHQIALSM
jgi:hypothetical protein